MPVLFAAIATCAWRASGASSVHQECPWAWWTPVIRYKKTEFPFARIVRSPAASFVPRISHSEMGSPHKRRAKLFSDPCNRSLSHEICSPCRRERRCGSTASPLTLALLVTCHFDSLQRQRHPTTGAHSMLRVAPTSKVTLISEFSLLCFVQFTTLQERLED